MNSISHVYGTSLALLTDLYQLTMAYGYWKLGKAEREAVFHLYFRKAPFKGSYAVAAGMGPALELISGFQFQSSDLDYLATLRGNDDQPLFEEGFLDYLADLKLDCDVDAVAEGTIVYPNEPLLRIKGSILQGQLLETVLLNMINFQTLIATKSARICQAAGEDEVLEFGLRRAQGIDGSLSASRAAYIGGAGATSNVLAGKLYGIPVKGTHAHSWVMSFDEELEAFEAYAQAMPNNCVFLVDTYDTLEGVKQAIQVGLALRQRGYEMLGIRLDSGDLAELSKNARDLLDQSGFESARIVASNDLDEYAIASLKKKGARIAVWGVGTRLATAYDQAALGGVYKLGAIQNENGDWAYRVKLSDDAIKTSIPGMQQVRRYKKQDCLLVDVIYDELMGPGEMDQKMAETLGEACESEALLQPMIRGGKPVMDVLPLKEVRAKVRASLRTLVECDASPEVIIEERLSVLRQEMIRATGRA